jgi:IS5 family transposase
MTPNPPPNTRNELDMFRSRLDNLLNRRHPLFVLAGKIDWSFFEREFGVLYVEKMGRPGIWNGTVSRRPPCRGEGRCSGPSPIG